MAEKKILGARGPVFALWRLCGVSHLGVMVRTHLDCHHNHLTYEFFSSAYARLGFLHNIVQAGEVEAAEDISTKSGGLSQEATQTPPQATG